MDGRPPSLTFASFRSPSKSSANAAAPLPAAASAASPEPAAFSFCGLGPRGGKRNRFQPADLARLNGYRRRGLRSRSQGVFRAEPIFLRRTLRTASRLPECLGQDGDIFLGRPRGGGDTGQPLQDPLKSIQSRFQRLPFIFAD